MKKITLVVDNTKNTSLSEEKSEDAKEEVVSGDTVSPNPHSVIFNGVPLDFSSKSAKDMWE